MLPSATAASSAGSGNGVIGATSIRIARASSPPSACTESPEADEQRAAERLAVDHFQLCSGSDAALGEVAQHLGLGVRHPHERPARPGRQRLEALGCGLLDLQLARGDRVTVGIVSGVSELARDHLLELLGEDVLQDLGLLVHAVPRDPQALNEVQLEQPVMAHHLERDPSAGVGQRHAVVGLVLDESELAEALDHPRGGGGGDRQPLGERVGADGLLVALLERVDRLGVVLDRRGVERIGFLTHGHRQDYAMAKL